MNLVEKINTKYILIHNGYICTNKVSFSSSFSCSKYNKNKQIGKNTLFLKTTVFGKINAVLKIIRMFVSTESFRRNPKLNIFNDKALPKGNKSERLVSQFLELSVNPKGNVAYKTFFDMTEENNFVSSTTIVCALTPKTTSTLNLVEVQKDLNHLKNSQNLVAKLATLKGFLTYYLTELPHFDTEEMAFLHVTNIYKHLTGKDRFINFFDFLVAKERYTIA